jgi:polyphosphate kinase
VTIPPESSERVFARIDQSHLAPQLIRYLESAATLLARDPGDVDALTRLLELAKAGIEVATIEQCTDREREKLARYFEREVYPILAAMAAWGERWLSGPEGTPLVLHHTTCDHDMHAVVVCSECDEPLNVREVLAKPGPGFAPSRP